MHAMETDARGASLHPITPSHRIFHHPVINTSPLERSETPPHAKHDSPRARSARLPYGRSPLLRARIARTPRKGAVLKSPADKHGSLAQFVDVVDTIAELVIITAVGQVGAIPAVVVAITLEYSLAFLVFHD